MDFKSSNIFAPTIEYAMYALYAKVGNIQSDTKILLLLAQHGKLRLWLTIYLLQ